MKYFALKALVGAIMYKPNTGEALLITTVEIYGRTGVVDPHYERPRVSYPPKDCKYPKVWPMSNNTVDGLKLIIGTNESNYLVTASVRADSKHEPEVGPTTASFILKSEEDSRATQIFIDREVYERAKELGQNPDCTGTEVSNSLYQLRQLRSKFDEVETYDKMRSSFDVMDIMNDQPVSIFTLFNHPKAVMPDDKEPSANYALGSKLFMEIAAEVLNKKYKAMLEKDMVGSIMYRFKDTRQQIPKIMREILDLFGTNEERIRIISNNELNRKLVQLASKLAPQITKANKDIIKNINNAIVKSE